MTAHHLSSQISAQQSLGDQETCVGYDTLCMHVSDCNDRHVVAFKPGCPVSHNWLHTPHCIYIMKLLCVCLCADLFGILSTEGEEGVLKALSLLAVGGNDPHLGGLHPLLLGMMGVHQHAAQLEEEGCRQVSLALHAYPTSCELTLDVYDML